MIKISSLRVVVLAAMTALMVTCARAQTGVPSAAEFIRCPNFTVNVSIQPNASSPWSGQARLTGNFLLKGDGNSYSVLVNPGSWNFSASSQSPRPVDIDGAISEQFVAAPDHQLQVSLQKHTTWKLYLYIPAMRTRSTPDGSQRTIYSPCGITLDLGSTSALPPTSLASNADPLTTGKPTGFAAYASFGVNSSGSAQPQIPKILISAPTVDFRAVASGQRSQKIIQIRNVGPADSLLHVSLSLPQQPFGLASGQSTSFAIKGGAVTSVPIDFIPTYIRMSRSQLVVTSNSLDINNSQTAVILLGATDAVVQFWIKAFIPGSIPAYTFRNPAYDGTLIPFPAAFPVYGYNTNQRSWSSSISASAKITLIGAYRITGYNALTRVPPIVWDQAKGACYSDGTVQVYLPTGTKKEATEKPSGSFGVPEMISDRFFHMAFNGSGTDPFFRFLSLPYAPSIDFLGDIKIDFLRGNFTVSGKVDEFPAYEMYFKPLSSASYVGNDLSALTNPVTLFRQFDDSKGVLGLAAPVPPISVSSSTIYF